MIFLEMLNATQPSPDRVKELWKRLLRDGFLLAEFETARGTRHGGPVHASRRALYIHDEKSYDQGWRGVCPSKGVGMIR